MPVKSLFVPEYALQGEDIPAHITWESLEYDHIRIELFPSLLVKEVFNAKYEYNKDAGTLIVREVEMEGYVGIIFKSKPMDAPFYKGKLLFSFIGKDGTPLHQEAREIELFRYNLVTGEVPDVIRIDPIKKFVDNRIPIKNQGHGTMLLMFLTSQSSELQKIVPSSYEEIKRKFLDDLDKTFLKVNDQFPQYAELTRKYLSFQRAEWRNYADIKKAKNLADKIVKCFNESEEFFSAFWIAIGEAVSKNVNIKTIPDRLLKYLNSLAPQKIILMNSEDILRVRKETKTLVLELMPTDLLLNEFSTMKLPPIRIVSTQEGDIEIFRLFRWGEER